MIYVTCLFICLFIVYTFSYWWNLIYLCIYLVVLMPDQLTDINFSENLTQWSYCVSNSKRYITSLIVSYMYINILRVATKFDYVNTSYIRESCSSRIFLLLPLSSVCMFRRNLSEYTLKPHSFFCSTECKRRFLYCTFMMYTYVCVKLLTVSALYIVLQNVKNCRVSSFKIEKNFVDVGKERITLRNRKP